MSHNLFSSYKCKYISTVAFALCQQIASTLLCSLRYSGLDLVSQGLSDVSITPAVGQRTQVVRGHDASSYGESFPRFRAKIKDLS